MDHTDYFYVKGVTWRDEPTEDYHLTLHSPSTLQSFIASFVLVSRPATFLFWFSVTALISVVTPEEAAFQQKISNPTQCYLPSLKQQTDKVSD